MTIKGVLATVAAVSFSTQVAVASESFTATFADFCLASLADYQATVEGLENSANWVEQGSPDGPASVVEARGWGATDIPDKEAFEKALEEGTGIAVAVGASLLDPDKSGGVASFCTVVGVVSAGALESALENWNYLKIDNDNWGPATGQATGIRIGHKAKLTIVSLARLAFKGL